MAQLGQQCLQEEEERGLHGIMSQSGSHPDGTVQVPGALCVLRGMKCTEWPASQGLREGALLAMWLCEEGVGLETGGHCPNMMVLEL
jgi:hypothetical protein